MDPSLVRIIGNTGKEGKGENQFTQPRGVCVDNATKELFVVDCNNHRIQVYHLNSLAYIRQIGKGLHGDAPGSLNYPVGLCLDDRNQLFVADTNNHRIVVFNRVTGGHVRSIGSQGTARGCLYSPYGVCIDMYTNVLYVADYDNHRVQAFNKDTGEFIRIIGLGYGTEDGQMNQPIVVCIDYEMDYLLVADYSNNRVVVFDKESGSFIRHIGTGNGPNSLAGPRGLCICKEVNILFVADREHHRIQLYDKTTYERLRSIGGEQGTDPGQFFRPMEICVNVEEGVLIVVDGYNHRVQIIEIPELQSEKRRLKALAQSKADAELNGRAVPKPSVLAVFTQLAGQERVLVDPVTNGLRLRFDHLGPLYDVHLPSSDIPLLLAHLAALPIPVHTVYAPRESEGGVSSRKSSSPFHPAAVEPSPLTTPGSLTERQAGMFLSILESLCHHDPQTGQSESNEATAGAVSGDSPYLLVAPALFALHSLLDRGWRPARITPAVVTLLAGFLADIGSGIASEAERCKVLEAIVAVLRAGVSTSEEVMESVLSAVLECLSHPVRYVMQAEDIAAVASSNSTIGSSFSSFVETDNAAVMLAYFDILSAIFSQVCDQPGGSHSPDSKPATICMSTSTTNASTSSKFLTPVISRVSSKVSLPCTPGAGGTGGGAGPCSASAASAHERRKHTSELRKDVLDFLFGVPFMFHLQDNRKTGSGGTKPVENESNRTLTIPLLTATSPATNMVTALPREVSVHDHPAFAMHPHIGAQVAAAGSTTATTATAASSATSISQQDTNTGTSTGAAVGIVVPTGLSSFISAAYLIRKLRHAQRSFSLGELSDKSRMLFAGDLLKSTSAQELEHGQIQLFRAASQYFHNMRSTGGGGGLSGAALAKRSRGGRNIWRPTEPLALGDLVDAQDKEKCWFESIVQEILEDGSIRVHFMGWGSKWDDTITGAELTERLAPLNTKTKNWRADLFQGGLIEIKCNDDPVNQKWMWGRITALNVEEAWVEVSYLFSNEPTVVKRAWLFGETICPVGMHTKEKSKAAAALLVKPLKKVEDIIRERAEEALPGDEAMFFDKADDLDESLLLIEGDSLKMSPTPTSCVPPVVLDLHGGYKRSGGAPHHAIGYVGVVLLECLMSELLSVANEMVQSREAESVDGETVHQERYEIALRLLTQLASSPFRRLLVPYFTRVLIFQCGMRAKLVSGGILSSRMSTAARSDLQDLHPIEQVLNQFKFMAGKYQALVTSALGTALSPAALQEITSRISATIDRCGVTQIANDLIELVQQHAHLRHALFAGFLRADDRFDEKSLKLRKILSYLFKTASRREAARFQELFEGTLLVAELREIDFTPRFDQQRVLCADWALQLVSSVVRLYETAQSVARLELLNIPQCHFAAERALCREFQQLSSGQVDVFAKALAIALSSLLDCSQLQDRPPAWKEATLKSVLGVQKNVMSEEMLFFFTPAYEALLARRLLTGNYSSLLVEKSVLEALPALPRSHKMLFDVTQTTHIAEFGKYLMSKIDSDELPYTPALNIVLQKRHFNVHILCQHTWHKHAYQPMFAKLTLPAPMRAIQAQFNAYYKSTQDITHSGAGTRRVTWCHGSGIVTLTCHQRGGYKVDIVVNEPQAAVLYAFNTGQRCKTLATLCAATNLSLEEIRSVIESLSSDSFQSPLLTVDTTANEDAGDLTPMSRIRLSNALVQGDIGGSSCSGGSEDEQLDYAVHSAAHLRLEDINTCKDWRNELIDAVIVRVLKQTARRAAFSSDYENSVVQNKSVLTAAELLETVPTELGKRGKGSQAMLTSQEIFARADHLASVGFIDKVDLLTTTEGAERLPRDELVEVSAVSVGYCYIAHSTTGSISDESIHCVDGNASLSEKSSIPTGRALFDQLLSMAALAKIPPDDSSVSATESLQGAGRAGAGVGTGAGGGGEGGVAERNREEADERSGDDNGGDCDESKDEAAQVVAPTVTLEHPFLAIRSAEPSSSHFTEESGIDFEFFAQSLIHWVASISPPTEVSTPHTAHWERLSEVKPFDDSNISDMKSQSPFLSPLRPESAGKYGGIESKSRDSPAAASTTVRWYPRVQNPSTPTAAVTASPLRGTPSRQHPALFAALTPTTPRTFPPLPHTTVRSPYATFSAQANAELKAIHERSYGALGALMSQVNALLYQHSLGRLPVSGQELNCAFPPPSIDAYLDEVSKAFVLDCPSLSDWSALHRDFFCALPAELIAAVKAKFRALIGRESATHFDGQDRLSDLWNTKFSVCSGPKSATSAKTTSGTLDNAESATEEDSKQSAAEEDEDVHASCELDHDPLEQPSHFKVQISLCEFVLSTFSEATSAAVAAFSRGGSAGHLFESEESAPLFQTSKSASLQAGTSTPNSFHRGEQSSPHGMVGSVSQKQEKRRPRNRGRPPSAFSHSNRTTPPVRRPSNEDRSPQSGSSPNLLRGRDLISANRTAREKSFGELSASLARLREAEGKLGLEECRESDLPAREHFPHHQSYSYGDYFLGSQAATHNNSSRESSRRSSRSDSNGDFAVAQLMHSIEEQLRTPAPPSFTAFPPFPPLPALNGDMAKPAAVDTANSKEAGGERRLSSSKLHPHPTIEENIYKPEHKKEEFSSSLLGAGFVGKPVTPLTIFSRPTAARESLHDLVTRYFQHLHAHLCGVFQVEKQADADADAVLGRSVCQQIIRHLLQNAAQRVAELAASSESSSCTALDSSHQDQMLWFLSCSEEAGGRSREIGGGDEVISIGLDRILRAAFHMMDVNQDCILTAEDFPNIKVAQCLAEADHSTTACDFDFNFCSEQERTDVVFGRDSLVVTVAEKASAMAKSRNQDFLSVVQSVQSLLALPSRSALQLLAQHRWSLEALADQTFAACAPHGDCGEDDAGNESLPLQLAQAHQRSNLSGKSFQRLSDSFVDLFARQILVEKTTDGERTVSSVYLGNYEQASALCESCQEPACCGDLYALRCRHYCCISCWQGHIEDAVQAQAGHICCVRCTPSPVNETTSVLHPAGLDFITAVVPKETVQAYLLNQLRLFRTDYDKCVSRADLSGYRHLMLISLQTAPRSTSGVAAATQATTANMPWLEGRVSETPNRSGSSVALLASKNAFARYAQSQPQSQSQSRSSPASRNNFAIAASAVSTSAAAAATTPAMWTLLTPTRLLPQQLRSLRARGAENVHTPPARITTPTRRTASASATATQERATSTSNHHHSGSPLVMPAGRMNKFSDGLSGVGIDGGTSAWASDRSEGHISRYLSETRTYMLAQAAEVENLLKVTQGAAKFESLSNKLALLDQYIRAVSLIEQVERGRDNRMHEMGNFRWHAQEEALEAVRDILIVSHIKMRSKWSAAEGLSAAVARETLSCMRLRMGQLLKVLAPDAVPRLQPLVQETYHSSSVTSNYNVECRRRYSARSLVVVTEDFTSDAAAIQMLIPPHPEPWKSFGDITGESLTMRTATASPTIEQTTAVSSSSSATSALDKFAECRKLVEKLSTHQSLNQIVLSRHLKSLEALVDSGYQTVLFANNACPVLVSIAEHNLNSFPICHLICSVLEKLCLLNAPCAHSLIDLNIWRLLSLLFAKRSNEAEFCIVGSRLMTAILTSAEENKKASFAAIESSSLFMMLKPVIRIHQVDFHTCQPLIQAIVHAVDKSYTAESSFMRSGLCEALISCIHQFGAFPGMKMQFVVLVSRLASGNKYMQDLLISMHVFEAIIDIISEYTLSDPMLIKSTCFAISSLVSRHHSGQTKFASAGGCKALCSTLRLNQDLHTLTYILRAMAALAQQNAYVQDVFQLESAAELLQAKREEISALSERSPSFETKSKLNLLLLTCEYALDAVRSPPVGRRPVLSTEYTGLPFADLPGISGRYGGGGSGDGGEDDALRRSRGLSLRMGLGLGLADGEPTGVGVDGDERASGETPDWLI